MLNLNAKKMKMNAKKNHTKVVSDEFCVISLFLQKLILGVM